MPVAGTRLKDAPPEKQSGVIHRYRELIISSKGWERSDSFIGRGPASGLFTREHRGPFK